jgi:hypothetical protein
LWHVDMLLDNETTAVAKQRPARNNESNDGSRVFCVLRSEAISRDRTCSVQIVSEIRRAE